MITSACGFSDGTLDRIHHALYLRCRDVELRDEASPAAYNRDKLRVIRAT